VVVAEAKRVDRRGPFAGTGAHERWRHEGLVVGDAASRASRHGVVVLTVRERSMTLETEFRCQRSSSTLAVVRSVSAIKPLSGFW
jgi:hypothetical protein